MIRRSLLSLVCGLLPFWGQSADFNRVDAAIDSAIAEKLIPGAVLAVVRHGETVYLKAYGNRQVYPSVEAMTTDTVFDLASCSKVVATATATMMLVEDGKIKLSDPVAVYLPGFSNSLQRIRIEHLLSHTSGLPPYADVKKVEARYGAGNKAGLLDHICRLKPDFAPETDCRYSCLNFITLQHIIERVSGESLREFTRKRIFSRLGMSATGYLPSSDKIAPTEIQPDGSVLRGTVHDPLARVMNGGVSGNAGLFSTASDLATFCAMLLNGGEWRGERILSANTVKLMFSAAEFAAKFGRTRGWMSCAPERDTFAGRYTSSSACGHTGYTGTCIVVDPEKDLAVVLLTNSVHPHDRHAGKAMRALRQRVCEEIMR